MQSQEMKNSMFSSDDLILITGGAGFIGSAVVRNLLERGCKNIRCLTRSDAGVKRLKECAARYPDARLEVIRGNLLSHADCKTAAEGAKLVLHLAAGRGEKLVPDAFLNSVVTTRNLLDACLEAKTLQRFVNVSSFAVYTNCNKRHWRLLDETCPVESHPELRDAYTFAKAKQDDIVMKYGKQYGLPYVLVRPGYVYGPGAGSGITGRVGSGTFGLYLHLGGSNPIPLSYVDNCADAIVLAGVTPGVDGEVFNAVDDELPSSRRFLRQYKKNVKSFRSIYVPKAISYTLCYLWESYSSWSEGQLPRAFNRKLWHAFWKKTRYSNQKLKTRVGWSQRVRTGEGMKRFFESCRVGGLNA